MLSIITMDEQMERRVFLLNEILNVEVPEMAGLSFDCSCGKRHSVDINCIIIGSGVIGKVLDIASKFKRGKVFIIADNNTYSICGKLVEDLLNEQGYDSYSFVFNTEHSLIPDEHALGRLFIEASTDTSLIIAVGSGTINDLARMVSYKMNIPYIIVGTAPSMDGYASIVSPLIVGGTKVTYTAVYPYAIIADMDIMKEAPMHMLQAGFGDILGKMTALTDWELVRKLNGEYYCETAAGIVRAALNKCTDNIEGILKRDALAISYLTEALILSGIAIGVAGCSRPASGAEHHIAHYWEIDAIRRGEDHPLHGNCVGMGTVVSSMMYRLMQDKLPEGINPPKPEEIVELLVRMGAAAEPQKLGITRELFRRSVVHAKDIRPRYSIFNYTQEAGLLEKYADVLTRHFYGE